MKILTIGKQPEFRLFLLYFGPIVLQPALKNDKYHTISLDIRILCNPEICIKKNGMAKKFLTKFVNGCSIPYEAFQMAHNTII